VRSNNSKIIITILNWWHTLENHIKLIMWLPVNTKKNKVYVLLFQNHTKKKNQYSHNLKWHLQIFNKKAWDNSLK